MQRNGFTLVELMVVITLIGLAGAAVVMSMGNSDRVALDAATRFAGRVGAARDAAVIGGVPVAAWVSPSGYGFERLSKGEWSAVDQKPPLAGDDWPSGVTVATADRAQLRIEFDSLGLTESPVAIRFQGGGQQAEVRVDSVGDIVVR